MTRKSIKEDFNTRVARLIEEAQVRCLEASERLSEIGRLQKENPDNQKLKETWKLEYENYRQASDEYWRILGEKDNPPWKPLLVAVLRDDLAEVIRLSDNGKMVERLNQEGIPILSRAFNLEIFDYLLSKGADPNLQEQSATANGFTPLCHAAYADQVEVFKKLLKAGADVKIAPKGDSVLQIAKDGKAGSVLAILRNKKLMAELTGKSQKPAVKTRQP